MTSLSSDILARIAVYTGDRVVACVLRNHIPEVIYKSILLAKRRVLIYGQVQSGKTGAIMDVVRNPLYKGIRKIVVIQNSLLVLNQYRTRFTASNIDFQVIHKETPEIRKEVVLLMNNEYRRKYYTQLTKDSEEKYVLIMDEADAYGHHSLATNAIHEYYVTATPHHPDFKQPEFFHKIQYLPPPELYQGLHHVNITHKDANIDQIVADFKQNTTNGMMLINCFKYVAEMLNAASMLSKLFPTICFVTLNAKHNLFINGTQHKLRKSSTITSIIDLLKNVPHVVFIANRMSLRGLSYTSGNYARHLTHQYSDLNNKTVTNSLQRMRIFGIYQDKHPIHLILPTNNIPIVQKMFASLEVNFDINRSFGKLEYDI